MMTAAVYQDQTRRPLTLLQNSRHVAVLFQLQLSFQFSSPLQPTAFAPSVMIVSRIKGKIIRTHCRIVYNHRDAVERANVSESLKQYQ